MGEGKQPTSFKLSSGLLVDATAAHLHSKQWKWDTYIQILEEIKDQIAGIKSQIMLSLL